MLIFYFRNFFMRSAKIINIFFLNGLLRALALRLEKKKKNYFDISKNYFFSPKKKKLTYHFTIYLYKIFYSSIQNINIIYTIY